MKRINSLIGAGLLVLLAVASSHAAVIFATNPTGVEWAQSGNPVTLGTSFTVGASPISITSLGYFDQTYPVGGNIGVGDRPALPCAVFAAYADDLIIENMVLRWGELRKAWRDGLCFTHVKGLTIEGGSIRQPLPGIGAAIHVQQCDDVCVRRVSAAHGTAIFFQAEDMPQGAKICCVGNDLREAETAFDPQLIPLLIDKIGNLTSSK